MRQRTSRVSERAPSPGIVSTRSRDVVEIEPLVAKAQDLNAGMTAVRPSLGRDVRRIAEAQFLAMCFRNLLAGTNETSVDACGQRTGFATRVRRRSYT